MTDYALETLESVLIAVGGFAFMGCLVVLVHIGGI